jgi:hypothetical protein
VDSFGRTVGAVGSPPAASQPAPPRLALLRGAATVLPRPVLAKLATAVFRGLGRTQPRLLGNLARLEPAVVDIAPVDLPYRFELTVGREESARYAHKISYVK